MKILSRINSNLGQKYTIFTGAVLLFLFFSLSSFVFNFVKSEFTKTNEGNILNEVKNLRQLIEIEAKEKNLILTNALKTADYLIGQAGGLQEIDSSFTVSVIHQESQKTQEIEVSSMLLNGEQLFQSTTVVDQITNLTGCKATFFQKTEGGYVVVSTSVLKTDGSRALNAFIPDSSPLVQTIEKGEVYNGRLFVVDDWYITMYKPLYVDGNIKGLLYVGVKENDIAYLKQIFNENKLQNTGYPFILNIDGSFVIHPTLEGTNIKNTKLGQELINQKNGIYKGEWPEDGTGEAKTIFFSYYEPYQMIIAASVVDYDFYERPLLRLRIILLIGTFISIILGFIGTKYIVDNMIKPVKKVSILLNGLSKGQIVDKISVKRTDELGKLMESLNVLINGLNNYSIFAQQIGKGNFNASFNTLSTEDVLGNSLLDMKSNLENAAQEDKKRNWTTEGLARFAEILRTNRKSVEELSYDVISNLIKYTNSNQGGIFILNDNNKDHPFLELSACYAYERKKFIDRKIEIGEGLVGQVFQEKEQVYLTDIPQNYLNITSGLGGSNPKSILIIPMIVNDEVQGVIEMASFNFFEDYQIDFIKKISENIASTIASVKVNENTKQLLETAQSLTEQMRSQEEEMRQNMEELQATQEEMHRREAENKKELEELRLKVGEIR